MSMTKTQIVRAMAEKIGTNNKTAAAFLENLSDMAVKEARKSGVFVLPGLGRLKKVNRKHSYLSEWLMCTAVGSRRTRLKASGGSERPPNKTIQAVSSG